MQVPQPVSCRVRRAALMTLVPTNGVLVPTANSRAAAMTYASIRYRLCGSLEKGTSGQAV